MRSKLGTAACMILGAFVIYCGQSMMNGDGGGSGKQDGFVKGATGDTCCTTPAQTFTKIAEGDITLAAPNLTSTTQPIGTGGYKEVVIYASGTTPTGSCTSGTGTAAQFRPNANTPFGDTGASPGDLVRASGSRLRVDGSDMRLVVTLVPNGPQCQTATIHYSVAGVN